MGLKAKRALVREPSDSLPKCITLHPLRHTINVDRARSQHVAYCETLSELGLEIIPLPQDNEHPDACFIEDTAVIVGRKALIGRMAKDDRRGEENAVELVLKQYLSVSRVVAPATMEGGDVIHLPDSLICGITQRTNIAGVHQMRDWLDVTVNTIEDSQIVHLKSHVTYLVQSTLVTTRAYAQHPGLKGFDILIVPNEESYAANTLTIGDTVLIPKGHPHTQTMIEEAGFTTIALDMSEFAKCEGALTCLSILF